ncbi:MULTISPECIES: hypothetical protein [unclassified Mucilaginibacter]|uniref:hypothetical protein n=1 Tax=unclassified Mucilaginibacter TaxID=2617802 RepID=UPI002AC8D14D|nr:MULTISPECIES: hypothetical protein [unclassified Mucilaginibacter]MEB0250164.1 hypothetical protein [Mucilaginibacter sp. 5B2]MEB0263112.1 hypothetical protein [Mucilaginibacter sp. 10I4]MEB0277752.1 hypothetical protein [Mucilaginibacter sp. 10B2]MEB0303025.1 hypothetical protein [Mucilaginibacter sp. 5C4]WPX24623.1 hypothetical protein RHM67_04965 [Mucilaginibacter sp. 5C4]
MIKSKALKIFIPVLCLLFIAAFAKHRLIDNKHLPESHLFSKEMDETSGLAASAINPDIYYAHNDSGDTSRFFAITADGKLKTTIYFTGDKKERLGVRDCEDIAVGPGPLKGKSYVYIGDIGDNSAVRKFITVYRAEERKTWGTDSLAHTVPVPLNLKYPDGAKDAEAITIDPIEKLLYIITKRGDSVGVYTSPLTYKANDTITLTFRGRLFFSGIKPFKWITAADVTADGKQILVKSYEKVYYWQRQANQPIWQALKTTPKELVYKQEKQGEAIAFTRDGKGYYTTSEGIYAPIYYYKIAGN